MTQPLSGVTLEREIERAQSSEVTKFKRAVTGQELETQMRVQQQNARGIVQSVAPNTNNPARPIDAAVYEQEAARQKQNNQKTIAATSAQLIEDTKNQLPKFTQIGGQLKYGEHVLVSKEGGEIVSLIRSLTSPQTNRFEALRKLQDYAQQGKPEAINFLGFASEFGLYGARKDASRAASYYQSAAAARYQPAVYNLALGMAYGRFGRAEPSKALVHASTATTLANDSSGRVCGLASFLAFRQGKNDLAIQFGNGCNSALSHLAKGAFSDSQALPVRVEWLRDSIATGADDGFAVIPNIAKAHIKTDNNATFCKYVLVAKYFNAPQVPPLRKQAEQCIDYAFKLLPPGKDLLSMREMAIAGISGFVPAEISELKNRRTSNKFHYSWAVPYLPLNQTEMDLFEPEILKAIGKP